MRENNALNWLKDRINYDCSECLIWPYYRDWQGRGRIGINRKQHKAHRVMCELVNGPCPEGLEAAHECGNGHLGCVHPKHLKWKTQSENAKDRVRHGRRMGNEGGNKTRFTPEQIESLRADLTTGAKALALADKYGVARSVIQFWKGKFAKNPDLVVKHATGTTKHSGGGWTSRIQIDGEVIYLGLFKTEKEANDAFFEARAKKHAGLIV